MPVDHRIKQFDDDKRACAGLFLNSPSGVSEAKPAHPANRRFKPWC
jgi:hypothetical protein